MCFIKYYIEPIQTTSLVNSVLWILLWRLLGTVDNSATCIITFDPISIPLHAMHRERDEHTVCIYKQYNCGETPMSPSTTCSGLQVEIQFKYIVGEGGMQRGMTQI